MAATEQAEPTDRRTVYCKFRDIFEPSSSSMYCTQGALLIYQMCGYVRYFVRQECGLHGL